MEAQQKIKTIIYLNSEIIGNGDDELGSLLMRNFLSTLGDFVNDITHILLVNSAVKLACKDSGKIDVMNMLEGTGVEILSCVTCLKQFDLQDKLKVGQESNMFSILEILTHSEKIIAP